MDNKNNSKEKHTLNYLFDALANSFLEDEDAANEFLKEEEIEIDQFLEADFQNFKKLHGELLLKKGLENQNWLQKKREEFLQKFREFPEQFITELSGLKVQAGFRNLDLDNLDEQSINSLFENANFLNYLEEQLDQNEKSK